MDDSARPTLDASLSGAEFRRWYWLKDELADELADAARALGIRSTGSKDILSARIAAALDGAPFTEPTSTRRPSTPQLSGPLTAATVIPAGQRCSQPVRAWFVEQVGTSFRFDAAMRGFFSRTDGTQTLQDALDHYRATRDPAPTDIDAQFEYNRFTRAWRQANLTGSRRELSAAWQACRSLPVDERGHA